MKPLSLSETAFFIRQLATLLSAGVPVIQSCEIIESTHQNAKLTSLLIRLKHDMLAGKSLYTSFTHHPYGFHPLICQLIRIGEETGQLDGSLHRIADYLEKRQAFIKHIQRMLFYPALTTVIAILITIGMLLFVIPRFAELFQTSSIDLPWWTRCIFASSAFMRHQGIPLITCVTAVSTAICYVAPTTTLAACRTTITSLPIIHSLSRQSSLAVFTRSLAMTFAAGINLPDAIELCIPDKSPLTPSLYQLQSGILAGLTLHKSMHPLACFPAYMVQLIKVGEESGKLDDILHHLANKMENDLQHRLSQLSQLLEPLIMIILGVVIGGLVIGMYLPIFTLGSAL